MEKVKKHKPWVVWLLLAVFALPSAVKILHINHIAEHSEPCCSDESHPHHDCNKCPICQFTLSTFTETIVSDFNFRVISFGPEPVIFFQNNTYQQVLFSYKLRAPPYYIG